MSAHTTSARQPWRPCSIVVTAALALALGCGRAPLTSVHGQVAPGFEAVRAEFERNFSERGERGAAVAAYYRGQKVVDLWGGERNDAHEPWQEDTLVPVFSTSKGIAALTLAMLHARGFLSYDERVAYYWPEFAQNGKGTITVRQLLSHEAGLVLLDQELSWDDVNDLDHLATILARQTPRWVPGSRHGYHLSTLGLYMNELVRRTDPKHRSLGRFLADEVTAKLGCEFYIGAPPSVGPTRVAQVYLPNPGGGLVHLGDPPLPLFARVISPWSVFSQSLVIPKGFDANDPHWWRVELPSGNGIGSARAVARLYAAFATGGRELGLPERSLEELEWPPSIPPAGAEDAVLGVDTYYALGFIKPSPTLDWGTSRRAYGMAGAGGSFGFADPDLGLGFGYVMNRMGYYLNDDPREVSLQVAVLAAAGKLERAFLARGGIAGGGAAR